MLGKVFNPVVKLVFENQPFLMLSYIVITMVDNRVFRETLRNSKLKAEWCVISTAVCMFNGKWDTDSWNDLQHYFPIHESEQ